MSFNEDGETKVETGLAAGGHAAKGDQVKAKGISWLDPNSNGRPTGRVHHVSMGWGEVDEVNRKIVDLPWVMQRFLLGDVQLERGQRRVRRTI